MSDVEELRRMVAESAFYGMADEASLLIRAAKAMQREAGLRAEVERLRAAPDLQEYKDALHDLVMLDAEQWATGGGPGFAERRKTAWDIARSLFEP